MKVARFSRTRPLLTITELLTGSSGPSGQVPVSNGSNTVSWSSNVANIWVNGTTKVLGPEVNIANGSNTTVTVDMVGAVASNTIRIHATTGAGSFGSNSTRVSEVSSAGASSDSSRADHIHDGIGTITASSSNTMQRGTWNVRAGSGIALALTDTDGDGEFDTTTIVNTGSGGGGGASSGALVFIAETVLGSDAADITITGISGSYRDLVLVIVARCAGALEADALDVQVGNGSIDTTGYGYVYTIVGSGSVTPNSTAASIMKLGLVAGDNATAGSFAATQIVVPRYADTGEWRQFVSEFGHMGVEFYTGHGYGAWKSTGTALERIKIKAAGGSNLRAGSSLAIYGRG